MANLRTAKAIVSNGTRNFAVLLISATMANSFAAKAEPTPFQIIDSITGIYFQAVDLVHTLAAVSTIRPNGTMTAS